jgi:membrane-associated phospholipid phosphatase
VLKSVGIAAFMAVFFIGYFAVLRHPLRPVTVMPLLALDRWVTLEPRALGLYVSLWFFVLLPPALIGEKRELGLYALAASTLAILGLGIFLLWPTRVPPWAASAKDHWTFDYLKTVDATGNACPSLHVAFAVFTALWLGWLLREVGDRGWFAALGWVWCLGILYSTMATRQHVAIDVIAGAALGATVALAFRQRRVAQRPRDAIMASG